MLSPFSLVFLVALVAAVALCIRRPFAGLLVLACATPFYTLLREASAGSGVFFVWPYLLMAVLTGVMVWQELTALLAARGFARPRQALAIGAVVMAAAAGVLLEAESRAFSTFVTDTSLSGMGRVLNSRSFIVLAFAGIAGLAAVVWLFLRAIRRREGRVAALDWAVAAFLWFGLFTIFVTYARSGILFTGLNGYRYFFAGALVYLPARYFMTTGERERTFVRVVMIATVIGAAELLFESYLLNVAGVPINELPWMGHLAREFGYVPEGDRGFFDGRYVPMGFMYMTHMSGLFLVLGYAFAVPRALAAMGTRWAIVVSAAAVIGACWTSRTVLLLLIVTYIVAAVIVKAGRLRKVAGLTALLLLVLMTSRFLIPGVRYDIVGETQFLAGEAFPNLIEAIKIDLQEMTGLRFGRRHAWVPRGWAIPDDVEIARKAVDGRADRYVMQVQSGGGSSELRFTLPAWFAGPNERVSAAAFLRSPSQGQINLQLFQGTQTVFSDAYRGKGEWHTLVVEMPVDPASTGAVAFDIDMPPQSLVEIDHVTFTNSRGQLHALGRDQDTWLPTGWTMESGSARVDALEEQGAPLLKITAQDEADLRFHVPPSMIEPDGVVRIDAHVFATSPTASLQVAEGGRAIDTVRHRGSGWEMLSLTIPRASGDSLDIDIDVAKGEALVESVRLAVPRGEHALFAQGRGLAVVAGSEPAPRAARRRDGPAVPPPTPSRPAPGAAGAPDAGPGWMPSSAFAMLFGQGAEFGMWNQVFFAEQTPGQFAGASYSDMKYLEFAQQFGFIGLAVLLWLAALAVWRPYRLATTAATAGERVLLTGVLLVMLTAFISLAHLPSLFRLGFSTVTFIALAIAARRAAHARPAE